LDLVVTLFICKPQCHPITGCFVFVLIGTTVTLIESSVIVHSNAALICILKELSFCMLTKQSLSCCKSQPNLVSHLEIVPGLSDHEAVCLNIDLLSNAPIQETRHHVLLYNKANLDHLKAEILGFQTQFLIFM